MRLGLLLALVFFTIIVVGCFVPPQKQGLPTKPVIGVSISGLPEGVLAKISVRNLEGWEHLRAERGNGYWEFVVHTASGLEHFVIAEEEGYVSQPDSYMIRLVGDKAYVVENGEIGEEALHLDFYFTPVN